MQKEKSAVAAADFVVSLDSDPKDKGIAGRSDSLVLTPPVRGILLTSVGVFTGGPDPGRQQALLLQAIDQCPKQVETKRIPHRRGDEPLEPELHSSVKHLRPQLQVLSSDTGADHSPGLADRLDCPPLAAKLLDHSVEQLWPTHMQERQVIIAIHPHRGTIGHAGNGVGKRAFWVDYPVGHNGPCAAQILDDIHCVVYSVRRERQVKHWPADHRVEQCADLLRCSGLGVRLTDVAKIHHLVADLAQFSGTGHAGDGEATSHIPAANRPQRFFCELHARFPPSL
ncbi:MAG: hypothetical protein BWY68_00068 [bacterium ADurb.Bin400]|nr:MAG: hypothetical protein BWY68_00068 [bacterium ADurb.Bin400]